MDSRPITYRLKQSKRKTISIYVASDGVVEVLAPETLSKEQVDQQVQAKAFQVFKHRAEFEALNASRRVREYVSGESFLYLGRNYRFNYHPNYPNLALKDGYFLLSKRPESEVIKAFEGFYRDKGKEKIPERARMYAERMGLQTRKVRVMELRTRWASCNDHNDLNFHWKCMMTPIKILDYIIVHELAHLVHRTHTQSFWALVDRVLPDYMERKNWLRVNGAGMGV